MNKTPKRACIHTTQQDNSNAVLPLVDVNDNFVWFCAEPGLRNVVISEGSIINYNSIRADNQYVSVSADISVIGRYIGLADKANAYRYRLSVSADKPLHIGF